MNIKLKQYQSFQRLVNPSDELSVATLLGISLGELKKKSKEDVDNLISEVTKWVSKEEREFHPTFKLNGITYGFIPNLDDITYGENKDITTFIGDWDTMHQAMSVAYRPIKTNWLGRPIIKKGKYEIVPYEDIKSSDIMLEVDVNIVLGMQVFFYNLMKELVSYIPNYLKRELTRMENNQEVSQRSGEAIKKYTHLLNRMSEDLMR